MFVASILFLLQADQTNKPAGGKVVSDECAVLATVAREHLGFDDRTSPPLRASGDYLPECPWIELGVRIGTASANRQAKLVFGRPRIQGDEAIVDSLVINGPLSGSRWKCELNRTEISWNLKVCSRTQAI